MFLWGSEEMEEEVNIGHEEMGFHEGIVVF